MAPGLAWFELIRTSHFFPSLFACRRMGMPIESNEAEDNEEREGDFYSHAHTWSFLLVQPIVAWKVLANKRHLEPTLRFELRDPQFKDPQFTKLPLLLDSGVFRVRRQCAVPVPLHENRCRARPDDYSGEMAFADSICASQRIYFALSHRRRLRPETWLVTGSPYDSPPFCVAVAPANAPKAPAE